jgi:hypothetical protein
MGHTEAADLLQQTLDEEKATDEKLTTLAESGINQEAADARQAGAGEDDDEAEEAAPKAQPRPRPRAKATAAKSRARR